MRPPATATEPASDRSIFLGFSGRRWQARARVCVVKILKHILQIISQSRNAHALACGTGGQRAWAIECQCKQALLYFWPSNRAHMVDVFSFGRIVQKACSYGDIARTICCKRQIISINIDLGRANKTKDIHPKSMLIGSLNRTTSAGKRLAYGDGDGSFVDVIGMDTRSARTHTHCWFRWAVCFHFMR